MVKGTTHKKLLNMYYRKESITFPLEDVTYEAMKMTSDADSPSELKFTSVSRTLFT